MVEFMGESMTSHSIYRVFRLKLPIFIYPAYVDKPDDNKPAYPHRYIVRYIAILYF
jgi:hypothetical protein